jgi:hypothetical protein
MTPADAVVEIGSRIEKENVGSVTRRGERLVQAGKRGQGDSTAA